MNEKMTDRIRISYYYTYSYIYKYVYVCEYTLEFTYLGQFKLTSTGPREPITRGFLHLPILNPRAKRERVYKSRVLITGQTSSGYYIGEGEGGQVITFP